MKQHGKALNTLCDDDNNGLNYNKLLMVPL
jgi:hypothetical protein